MRYRMLKVIKNQRMAAHLMTLGFRLVKTDEDKLDKNRNVYLFNDTPQLHDAMVKYSNK